MMISQPKSSRPCPFSLPKCWSQGRQRRKSKRTQHKAPKNNLSAAKKIEKSTTLHPPNWSKCFMKPKIHGCQKESAFLEFPSVFQAFNRKFPRARSLAFMAKYPDTAAYWSWHPKKYDTNPARVVAAQAGTRQCVTTWGRQWVEFPTSTFLSRI